MSLDDRIGLDARAGFVIDPAAACTDTTHSPRYRWRKVSKPHWICPDCDEAQEQEKQ